MSNMICFDYKSDKDDLKDDLNMSNGVTRLDCFAVSAQIEKQG